MENVFGILALIGAFAMVALIVGFTIEAWKEIWRNW